ncbi:hypothetical protein XELAEV_18000270mg [Xenopus laevis]|uniref:Uncharacterized protein n=1 Tax=Xenopus laevis TaxID=8355 RepID=A0A974BQA8_XENLA|nr:hypothetical protein XELAEV_18000270mg [Xenopus laevis]
MSKKRHLNNFVSYSEEKITSNAKSNLCKINSVIGFLPSLLLWLLAKLFPICEIIGAFVRSIAPSILKKKEIPARCF